MTMKYMFLGIVLTVFIATISCENKSAVNSDEFDYSQFDYLEHTYFLKTWLECQQQLPDPKKLVVESEDGFTYEFGTNNISQNATFLFYGADFFSEANIEIDFSKNAEKLESTFMYITKLIENHRGKAALHDVLSNQETITWFEETMDGVLYVLSLTKYDQLIVFSLRAQEMEYGADDEGGEWVQRGPDGEWVWVPNE
jgi:hypothetical protein